MFSHDSQDVNVAAEVFSHDSQGVNVAADEFSHGSQGVSVVADEFSHDLQGVGAAADEFSQGLRGCGAVENGFSHGLQGCGATADGFSHDSQGVGAIADGFSHDEAIGAEGECDEKAGTVLLVEDNEELLHVLEDILKPFYRVLLAHDGREGLAVARREVPDIVVSDVMMPGMSGTEMCVALKNDFATCHIPVILLTALSSVEHSLYGLQHGADDYISKPFNEKVLITRCNNLVRGRLIIKNKFIGNADFDIQTVSSNPIDQKFLDTINRIIESNFDNPAFSVNLLASELHISRTSMYSKFEALTGMTPNDYVQQRRLRKASEMLRIDYGKSVSEVSDALGFGSSRYFSRCFKTQFGVSPAEYRKNHLT